MAGFDYQIIRKPNRKTASIFIKANNDIEVRVPTRMPLSLINEFVESKQQWINKKLQFNNDFRTPYVEKTFVDGELFQLLGHSYPLQLNQGKRSILIDEELLKVSQPNPQPESIRRQLTKWYRMQAESHFFERCNYFAEIIGKQPQSVATKTYKSRWGSCHIDGRVYFNWRLIMAPVWVIDYVVVHELCHLIHHNHSRAYWQLVETIYPDYQSAENWLKTDGLTLDF